MAHETLAYETSDSAAKRIVRPWWVYILVVVYALLLTGMLGLAILLSIDGRGDRSAQVLVGTLLVLLACAASLILVPVRAARRRQMKSIPLWIPLLGSATLVGLLAFGGTVAWLEYIWADQDILPIPLIAAGVVWILWAIVFGLLAWARTPERVANVLHRWVLAGSVLELLVAIPTHVIVRRREECCAGMATGLGICIGIAVMIAAFGPSVALLYYRRWKQITPKVPSRAYDGTS